MPSSIHSSSDERDKLRHSLRQARRALPSEYRHEAALEVAKHLSTHRWYRNARRIGFYYPVGSELDTGALMVLATRDRKELYLPAISRRGSRLRFVRMRAGSDYSLNRHGIPEPMPQARKDILGARQMDLVLLPLLGFDAAGNRLGSGAGYYDRSFDFKRRLHGQRPRLIGLAFDCQQISGLKPEPWDVALDGVVTESGTHLFR